MSAKAATLLALLLQVSCASADTRDGLLFKKLEHKLPRAKNPQHILASALRIPEETTTRRLQETELTALKLTNCDSGWVGYMNAADFLCQPINTDDNNVIYASVDCEGTEVHFYDNDQCVGTPAQTYAHDECFELGGNQSVSCVDLPYPLLTIERLKGCDGEVTELIEYLPLNECTGNKIASISSEDQTVTLSSFSDASCTEIEGTNEYELDQCIASGDPNNAERYSVIDPNSTGGEEGTKSPTGEDETSVSPDFIALELRDCDIELAVGYMNPTDFLCQPINSGDDIIYASLDCEGKEVHFYDNDQCVGTPAQTYAHDECFESDGNRSVSCVDLPYPLVKIEALEGCDGEVTEPTEYLPLGVCIRRRIASVNSEDQTITLSSFSDASCTELEETNEYEPDQCVTGDDPNYAVRYSVIDPNSTGGEEETQSPVGEDETSGKPTEDPSDSNAALPGATSSLVGNVLVLGMAILGMIA